MDESAGWSRAGLSNRNLVLYLTRPRRLAFQQAPVHFDRDHLKASGGQLLPFFETAKAVVLERFPGREHHRAEGVAIIAIVVEITIESRLFRDDPIVYGHRAASLSLLCLVELGVVDFRAAPQGVDRVERSRAIGELSDGSAVAGHHHNTQRVIR